MYNGQFTYTPTASWSAQLAIRQSMSASTSASPDVQVGRTLFAASAPESPAWSKWMWRWCGWPCATYVPVCTLSRASVRDGRTGIQGAAGRRGWPLAGRSVNLRRARRRLQWCTGHGLYTGDVLGIRTMTTLHTALFLSRSGRRRSNVWPFVW
jgi:hypothetical protein